MKWKLNYMMVLVVFVSLSAFTAHRFYVSIFQINEVPEKKTLQITSRIFIDDLNAALENKYNSKTYLGEKNESAQDVNLMRKYLLDHFSIKINGQPKPIHFLSHEFENNVIICYFTVKDATKIKTMEIRNTALFDLFPDQQHIINATLSGKKQSLLLTSDQRSGVLK